MIKKKTTKKGISKRTAKKKAIKGKSPSIKVEVEFDHGRAEVEVNINGKKEEFILRTKNQKTVISRIAKKTGIGVGKLKKIIKFDD